MNSNNFEQLQLIQQNLQNVLLQKQQIQTQILEYNSALQELKTTETAYKIVGKIMFAASKEELNKDLNEKKEVAEVRLKNFVQQEQKLQQEMDSLQKEVMEDLKQSKN